jgi:hypothetical protein
MAQVFQYLDEAIKPQSGAQPGVHYCCKENQSLFLRIAPQFKMPQEENVRIWAVSMIAIFEMKAVPQVGKESFREFKFMHEMLPQQ